MTYYDMPDTIDELFANVPAVHTITDTQDEYDNVQSMLLFLDAMDVPEELIELNNGTHVILNRDGRRIEIHAGGLGDCRNHRFDVDHVMCAEAERCQREWEWTSVQHIRGVDVVIYAGEFTSDRSVGMNWGPEVIGAVRCDNGTEFDLTDEEMDLYAGKAADETDEFPMLDDDVI